MLHFEDDVIPCKIAIDGKTIIETVDTGSQVCDTLRRKFLVPIARAHAGAILTDFSHFAASEFWHGEWRGVTYGTRANRNLRCNQLRLLNRGATDNADREAVADADAPTAILKERTTGVIGIDKNAAACDIKCCFAMHPERFVVIAVAGWGEADHGITLNSCVTSGSLVRATACTIFVILSRPTTPAK